MNFLIGFLKGSFKNIITTQMKSRQDKIITRLLKLIGGKVPMSGELEEHLITEIYDAFEIVIGEEIDQIGKHNI